MLFSTKDMVFADKLHYPDLEINKSRVTFITGESGSGKSTLLKMFNATVTPSAGRVFYKSEDIAGLDTISLRRQVLLVGQTPYLFDATIKENFATYYKYRELEAPDDKTMASFLGLTNAAFPLDSQASSMSGGERQRVYMAICLSFKPQVLMLDEPTSALDEANAIAVFEHLKKWCAENCISLIVISHAQELVDKYADEIIVVATKKQSVRK